jgi:hypothetical protein
MKRAALGALVGAGLVAVLIGLFGQRCEVFGQRMALPQNSTAGSGDLIAVTSSVGEKGHLLTVIDPRQQTIGVYSIDLLTGKITLRSVRAIRWDLQMTDFNCDNPLPREVRLQLEQR